ncbi:MAG: SH3 domain-containing protein [Clostridia bacterium]|nr:SH3 domain-containing protein [Clostridia bacterium]
MKRNKISLKIFAALLAVLVLTSAIGSIAFADTGFKYQHDPRENKKAMEDIIVNPNAVYGFSPSATGSLEPYAKYDWTDPAVVEEMRKTRLEYLASYDEMYDILLEMTNAGASVEEMARAVSGKRNELRFKAYENDPEGLATLKERNLLKYGHEEGPLPDELYEQYGSWETVLEKAFAHNPGVDACVGLYDDYYEYYLMFGYVKEVDLNIFAYYDADGVLIKVKALKHNIAVDDIYDFINFYKPEGAAVSKIFKFMDDRLVTIDLDAPEKHENKYNVAKAPNVTEEMSSASHWIKDLSNDILLGRSEIEDLNEDILHNNKTYMNDLDALPETFNGKEYAKSLSSFESPAGMYLGGAPVPESYYEAIRKNIADADVKDTENVRYAIATERTVLKAYPYEDWLSDSDWDKEWDNFANSAILLGEPLLLYNTTADGKFIYARCVCCEGWVKSEDVAVCRDKAEWQNAKNHKNFLLVTGGKVYLEESFDKDISGKMMTMGTKLELAENVDFKDTNRLSWNNYAVKLPVRREDGSYAEKTALISENRDVNIGFLPYTTGNVVAQAYKSLGDRYGWGGMMLSQDCSSFVREVYLCFGIVLPRNTTWQAAMPTETIDLSGMTDEQKKAALDNTPPGAILFIPGHEMMYLGSENGLYYTINDISSLVSPADPEGGIIRPRSIIVNDLSTLRGNGSTWLSNLTCIKIVK